MCSPSWPGTHHPPASCWNYRYVSNWIQQIGEPVKDASGQPKRIDFDRLNILDSTGTTLDRTIKQSELEFFEPEERKYGAWTKDR